MIGRLTAFAASLLLVGSPAASQARIDLNDYVLGVDVPESPALVAIGTGTPALLGSAPKPLAAAAEFSVTEGSEIRSAGIDVTPGFLFAGVRNLDSYRANSIGGRLLRVVTKTVVSFGAADLDFEQGTRVSLGLRSTLHDPHDPVLNSKLPEEVAEASESPDPEDAGDAAFTRARSAMRGRSGDAQVSAGWGLSALASGGSLHGDSLGSSRHVLWLNAQYTTGSSFDLVGSVEVRNVFRGDARTIPGFALRRKGTLADFHAGVRYDTSDHVLHPLLVVDARWLTGLGSIIWIDTNPASPDPASRREVRLGLTLKGFTAADPVRS